MSNYDNERKGRKFCIVFLELYCIYVNTVNGSFKLTCSGYKLHSARLEHIKTMLLVHSIGHEHYMTVKLNL